MEQVLPITKQEKERIRHALYRANNKEKVKAANANYYIRNKEAITARNKKYASTHKEQVNAGSQRWRDKNREYSNQLARESYHRNKERNRTKTYARRLAYHHNRPSLKIRDNLRARLGLALKGKTKIGSAIRDLGCTIEFLWEWLEFQFIDGMTRENYGPVWHVDHIIPLSKLDLMDRKQFLIGTHFTNLRPLFAIDNIKRQASCV